MMPSIFRRESVPELEAKLEEIDADIARHPIASEKVKKAHRIVENRGDKSDADLTHALAASGLPALEELGRIQLEHTGSWWRLHRARNKIITKIQKLKR
ncbi:hypothetical protein [Luethyella okanaganae]|uniref:Uncharacterized protein n=1 Tax=Luethyella okanaganae TaxID=69372 RepID=A0ABW1VI36_9MICO